MPQPLRAARGCPVYPSPLPLLMTKLARLLLTLCALGALTAVAVGCGGVPGNEEGRYLAARSLDSHTQTRPAAADAALVAG